MLRGRRLRLSLAGAGIGVAGGGLFLLLWPYLGAQEELPARLASLGLRGGTWTAFLLYHALFNPWIEEAYWRGYLGSTRRGPAGSDVWFAGYHLLVLTRFVDLPWLVPSFLVLAGAAWFWRTLARASGGLWVCCLSHLAADASILLVVHLRAGV